MPEDRPKIEPGILAEIASAAPRRLVSRLDAQPNAADNWKWTLSDKGWEVTAESADIVSLPASLITSSQKVSCSCLLSPRCFHLLAVLSVLPLAEQKLQEEPQEEPQEELSLSGEQIESAQMLWQAGAEILATGAQSAGAIVQAEMLRAVHACRATGLHKAAAAGLRVVRSIRDLREEKPEFSLTELAADLQETLHTALLQSEGSSDAELVGTSRRSYSTFGNTKLAGLFTEPVIAATGYAGVVTYMTDQAGTIWTVSDVLPGVAQRALAAYGSAAGLGDAAFSHRRLGREGLFVSGATGSKDGRLGAGSGVKAVGAGISSWSEAPCRRLWEESLAAQIERCYSGVERAGSDLLFLQGEILGASSDALLVALDSLAGPVRLLAPSDHEQLAYIDNLRLLVRAAGYELMFVARILPERPRTALLLAVGPVDPPCLLLPSDWAGRCNLGLDRLQSGNVVLGTELLEITERSQIDPLTAFRRRLERMVIGGQATLQAGALSALETEARVLEGRMMPTAACRLRALGQSANTAARTTSGARRQVDASSLARTWLSGAIYSTTARRVIARQGWL